MHKILNEGYNVKDLAKRLNENNSEVVISGCGIEGKLLLHAMLMHNIKVKYFIDSNKKLHGRYHLGIKIISAEELAKLLPNAHIFIGHKWITLVVKILNKLNFKNIYTCVDFLKSIDVSKKIHSEKLELHIEPLKLERTINLLNFSTLKALAELNNKSTKSIDSLFVKFIDIVITERCSMKCRDCANLMQFYVRPKNSDINLLFKYLDRLMKCVDYLQEFRVIGGDPFMNKEMYKVVNKMVEYENVGEVTVYTNARIIPKGENLSCLKNKKVRLQITNYENSAAAVTWGDLSTKHETIVKLLASNNIKYVSDQVIKWDDIGSLKFIQETPAQLKNKFNDCCANDLLTLLEGVLYKCPVSAHGTNLKAFSFDSNYDGIDLTDEKISLKSLKEKLIDFYHNNKYVTACSYCRGRGYGEGEVKAAIQTRKALPLFAQL